MLRGLLVTVAGFFAIASADMLLEPRQLEGLSPACQSAASSLLPLVTGIPPLPTELATVAMTNPCSVPSLTGAAATQFSSWSSSIDQWYSSHSDQLNSALSACSELTQYATGLPICDPSATHSQSHTDSHTSGHTASPTGSATGSHSGSASGSTPAPTSVAQGHAAPRETGFVGPAALAAAGILGLMAL
jgi:hypothetical protein